MSRAAAWIFQPSGEYLPIPAKGDEANKQQWVLASGSTRKQWFTPCVMGKFIYLCGGRFTSIELFDTDSKAFAGPAGVQLPEASGCIAFMRGSVELVVISKTKVSVFPVLNGSLQQGESKDHRELDIFPNSTPVLFPGDGLSIYFTCYDKKCVRFILEADNSVRAIDKVSA